MPRPLALRGWFAALLCLSLVGWACGAPIVHSRADAGAADAGVVDAGPMQSPIGPGCKKDSDCASGHCDTRPSGGYCLNTCTDNTSCPSGSACAQIGDGKAYCVSLCTDPTQCSGPDTCLQGADICVPATNGCQMDSDCASGDSCDTTTGLCSGAVPLPDTIGNMCSQDSDCTTGHHPFCITPDMGFSNGYCTAYCRDSAACGASNACVLGIGGGGQSFGLCMQSCTSNNDCRSDYLCNQYQGQSFCFPVCHSDQDCIASGATCDTMTGLCSGGDMDAGTPDAGMDAGTPDAGMDAGMADAGIGDGGMEIDAGPYTYDGGYPAPFSDVPQVINARGPVLKSPVFVPIFFSNDDPTQVAQLEDFDSRVGATNYWATIGKEYGVGPATSLPPVVSHEIATGTIQDSSIQTWIHDRIGDGTLPPSQPGILYILHYPPSMSIVLQGQQSCFSFGGYHSDFALDDGTTVAYAVVPRCSGNQNASVIDQETGSESHEMIEAATDPYPMDYPAYAQVDNRHLFWELALGGSEVGDMCAQSPDSFVQFPELPYVVQRAWSNAAAKAGRDPCIPELPGEVYFNAVPEMNDTISTSAFGPPLSLTGVNVASGDPKTVGLDMYSEGPTTGPWSVKIKDGAGFGGGGGTLNFGLDRTAGWNGDKLNLTITPTQKNPGNLDIFFVISTMGKDSHFWVGLAGQ